MKVTWVSSLFGCAGCKAKDGEIAFLRGVIASSRTIERVVETQTPYVVAPVAGPEWTPPKDAEMGTTPNGKPKLSYGFARQTVMDREDIEAEPEE